MSDQQDPLLCPICFDTPIAEIFQCKNGHCICSQCVPNLPNCPQCRIPYKKGKIRNRGLEALLDTLTFSCPHEKRGCTQKVKRGHKEMHARKCRFNPLNVSLCPIFGYKKCNFVIDPFSIQETIAHFVQQHDFRLHVGLHCDIRHQLFKNITDAICTKNADHIAWQPLILIEPAFNMAENQENDFMPNGASPAVFLVFSKIFGQRNSICWYCIQLGFDNTSKSQLFEVEFQIQENFIKKHTASRLNRIPDLRWKVPPLKYLETKAISADLLIQFRTDVLSKNYRELVGDTLLVQLSIRRKWKQDRKGIIVNLAVAPSGLQAPPELARKITDTHTINAEWDEFAFKQNLNSANSTTRTSNNINTTTHKNSTTLMDFITCKWFSITLIFFCSQGVISGITLFWFWILIFVISFFRQ